MRAPAVLLQCEFADPCASPGSLLGHWQILLLSLALILRVLHQYFTQNGSRFSNDSFPPSSVSVVQRGQMWQRRHYDTEQKLQNAECKERDLTCEDTPPQNLQHLLITQTGWTSWLLKEQNVFLPVFEMLMDREITIQMLFLVWTYQCQPFFGTVSKVL